MKPELILQTDLLDILFYNRNKDYGAYTLRKQYNARLAKAVGGTFALAALFCVCWYVQLNYSTHNRSVVAGQPVKDVLSEDSGPRKKTT